MFKDAIKLLLAIVFSPKIAWKELSESKENNDFFKKNYLYPVILMIAFSSLIGGYFGAEQHFLQSAFKEMFISLIVVCGSYLISTFCLNEYLASVFPENKGIWQSRQFIAYASAINYCLYILLSILSDLFFLWMFSLYSVYLVYIGSYEFLKIEESRRGQFVVVASILVLFVPYLIKTLLCQMINKA